MDPDVLVRPPQIPTEAILDCHRDIGTHPSRVFPSDSGACSASNESRGTVILLQGQDTAAVERLYGNIFQQTEVNLVERSGKTGLLEPFDVLSGRLESTSGGTVGGGSMLAGTARLTL